MAKRTAVATITVDEILVRLRALGDEKVRAQTARRGAGANQFGVKLGDLRTLANTIKKHHALALQLWDTGNADARLLATLLLEPKKLSIQELDGMVRSAPVVQVADWLYAYVIKEHPEKDTLRGRWMASDDPMAARAGWSLTAGRVARSPDGLDLPALLDRLESQMSTAAPETQWTMNSCLAAIGIHHPPYRARAMAIGERLGLYRDYPVSAGCTSPFAPIWIAEMVRRQG